jgi:DNA-binding NarL/FixJ family response regulator
MSRLLILVATEPPLTREAIAVALQQVRPDIDTIAADPAALAEDIARYHPDVAIISDRHDTVEARVPTWVRLSPNGGNAAVASVVGRRQEIAHLRLADLVSLVDQTPGVAA